jgi:bacteriocin-like protein
MKKQNQINKLASNKANVQELTKKSLSNIVGGFYEDPFRYNEYGEPLPPMMDEEIRRSWV